MWAKQFLPPALKSCPKCNKLPNLVTLPSLYKLDFVGLHLFVPFSLSLLLLVKAVLLIVLNGGRNELRLRGWR